MLPGLGWVLQAAEPDFPLNSRKKWSELYLVCLFPEDTTQLRDLLSSVSFLIKDDVLTMVGRIYHTNKKVYTLRWRSQAIHEQATKLEICDLTFSWHLAQEGSLDIPSKGCRSSERLHGAHRWGKKQKNGWVPCSGRGRLTQMPELSRDFTILLRCKSFS